MVFGVGGYSSFPVCFASKTLGIPLLIYENNLLLGKANKILSFFAKKFLHHFLRFKELMETLKQNLFIAATSLDKKLNYKHNFNEKNDLKILVLGGAELRKFWRKNYSEF